MAVMANGKTLVIINFKFNFHTIVFTTKENIVPSFVSWGNEVQRQILSRNYSNNLSSFLFASPLNIQPRGGSLCLYQHPDSLFFLYYIKGNSVLIAMA